MNGDPTFLELLIKSIKSRSRYDPEDEVAPVAIVWVDSTREWEPLLPLVRQRLSILTLGPYDPEKRCGPSIWIRCMLARTLANPIHRATVPVVYLPGIALETFCQASHRPKELEPLAELVYQGEFWLNANSKCWSVGDFFQDPFEGPGVQVRGDDVTRKAMLGVLPVFGQFPLSRLREDEPWRVKDFQALESIGIEMLIQAEENATLERKASLRWDMNKGVKDTRLEINVIKSVAGFLNSDRGGILLIGVENNGNVCGIEMDYQAFGPEYQNTDYYEQCLVAILLNNFGKEFSVHIRPSFHRVNGKTVCKVSVSPAPEPVFVPYKDERGQKDDHFFLRINNVTHALSVREAINHYKICWGGRK